MTADNSYVSVGSTIAFFRLRRVKWKIMLPFAVLTALFAVFATKNVTELVTSSLEDRLDTQLIGAAQHAADVFAKQERDQLEVVRTVANTEGVAEAITNRDGRAAEQLILPAAANAGVEHVEVFDRNGAPVYRFLSPVRGGVELSSAPSASGGWPSVRAVLDGKKDARGDKWAELADTPWGPVLLSAGPIKDARGEVVGVAVTSTSLSTIVREVKKNSLSDATIFAASGEVLSSTFDIADASEGNGSFHGGDGQWSPGSGSEGVVLGRGYQFLNSSLLLRGQPAGAVSVALPADAVASTGQEARLRMSLIFGAITLAVMAIGWFVARHLTSPLTRLVTAAAAVSGGDLSARSNVRTNDEIGVLGASFDSMAARLEEQHLATIGALASAIDARDPHTAGHSVRVGDLSAELGNGMGLPKPALHHLRVGGLLHDIGKIGIRDTVLLKPGALDEEERRLIEQHPTIGLRILEGAHLPREVLEIVGGHHERLDGSGYPLGLSLEEISLFPRLTAVADMYDALTTDRPYRRGLSPQEAIRILWRDAERGLLDGEAVATMRRIVRQWEERRASSSVHTKAWLESLQAVQGGRRNVA